ncbi:transposase [Nocardia nova]
MQDDYPTYELLARHLDSQFGNIYEYNLGPEEIAGFVVQEWTDELRAAVRHYLIAEVPADVFEFLFDGDEGRPLDRPTRESRVDALIEQSEPWEVALSVRNAAVAVVPTLRELIGQLDGWPSEDERSDAETWLETHGDTVDWRRLAAAIGHDELTTVTMPSGRIRQLYPDDLIQALTPAELVAAWEFEIGPAPTDLTANEWQLLEHHLGPRNDIRYGDRLRPARELDAKRRTFDAMRFKAAYQVPWSHVPARYGSWQSIYQAYYHYQAEGLFVRLRDALCENPDATQLVEWLDDVVADRPGGRGFGSDVQADQDSASRSMGTQHP